MIEPELLLDPTFQAFEAICEMVDEPMPNSTRSFRFYVPRADVARIECIAVELGKHYIRLGFDPGMTALPGQAAYRCTMIADADLDWHLDLALNLLFKDCAMTNPCSSRSATRDHQNNY